MELEESNTHSSETNFDSQNESSSSELNTIEKPKQNTQHSYINSTNSYTTIANNNNASDLNALDFIKGKIQEIRNIRKQWQIAITRQIGPQKLLNSTEIYKLDDDLYISELQIQAQSSSDMPICLDEPFNSFKIILQSEINIDFSVLSLEFEDYNLQNIYPIDYLIERFKSLNDMNAYNISQKLQYYKNLQEQNNYRQKLLQVKQNYNTNNVQRSKLINKALKQHSDKLIFMVQLQLDTQGHFKIQSLHYGEKGVEFHGYSLDEFQILGMKYGFKKLIGVQDVTDMLIRHIGLLSEYQKCQKQKLQTKSHINIVRRDGTTVTLEYLCTFIFENDIILLIGQYIKLMTPIHPIKNCDVIYNTPLEESCNSNNKQFQQEFSYIEESKSQKLNYSIEKKQCSYRYI